MTNQSFQTHPGNPAATPDVPHLVLGSPLAVAQFVLAALTLAHAGRWHFTNETLGRALASYRVAYHLPFTDEAMIYWGAFVLARTCLRNPTDKDITECLDCEGLGSDLLEEVEIGYIQGHRAATSFYQDMAEDDAAE